MTDTNVCRSSRGAHTPSMPAFLHRVRKSRRTCETSSGVPTLVVNTAPEIESWLNAVQSAVDHRDAGVIVKVRNDVIGHYVPPATSPCKFDTILPLGEALLSSGQLCRKSGTPSQGK